MADFEAQQGSSVKKHGKGKVRSKKISTRVDLTPMVDLAFLLIAFFMLTTTLSKPQAMQLNMPKKTDEDQQKVKQSALLNLILDENDRVWYYEGDTLFRMKKTTFAAEGVRQIIYNKQKEVERTLGDKKKTIVLIKMTDEASYANMVDILDEMDITSTATYAIQDLSPLEKEAIANGGEVKPVEIVETVTQ